MEYPLDREVLKTTENGFTYKTIVREEDGKFQGRAWFVCPRSGRDVLHLSRKYDRISDVLTYLEFCVVHHLNEVHWEGG
jgi:hypothetical protein